MINKNILNINKLILIFPILLLVACSTNKISKNISHKKNIFIGIGFGKDENMAIKNAKNDAINQIIQSMGVNVKINSSLENIAINNNKKSFEKTLKDIKVEFISKAFLRFKILDREISQNKNKVKAKIKVYFNEKDYQSTYKYFLNNYTTLISYNNLNYLSVVQSMKIIAKIEDKIRNLSGVRNLKEWHNFEAKKSKFIDTYKNTDIEFAVKNQINGRSKILIKSSFKIKAGEITLKIGEKLLHKKVINNVFSLHIPQQNIAFVLGNWKTWPTEFQRSLVLVKKAKINIKIINSHNKTNFIRLLKQELRKDSFNLIKNPNSYSKCEIKIKSLVKYFDENIADIYFAKMYYQIKLVKNKKVILKIHLPNYEFPTQKISGKNKKEVLEKASDFRNFSNYNFVLKKIVEKIRRKIQK